MVSVQVLTPVARWKPNGCPGGCHLQDIMQNCKRPIISNQGHAGETVEKLFGCGRISKSEWSTQAN